MSGYSEALRSPFHNWLLTIPTTCNLLTDGIWCSGVQFAGASGHECIRSVSDCVICAVRNAISYCTAVTNQADTSHSHVDDLPIPEQDALHIQVALHVLHALATFMGSIVKGYSEPRPESEELVQHLRYIQSSAHEIVSAHALGGELPAEPGMLPSNESLTKTVHDARQPSLVGGTSIQTPPSTLCDTIALESRQPLKALPISLAHFAEFGQAAPDPSGHQSWSAMRQPAAGKAMLGDSPGRSRLGLLANSWLPSQPNLSSCSHILFQPPPPPAHTFPHRTNRHRRFVPPDSHPPYLDTINPLSIASAFSANAPPGGDAQMHPSALWSLLDGQNDTAQVPTASASPAQPAYASLTPTLAAFAMPKPVQRAFWHASAQRLRLRSQSPPFSHSPPAPCAVAGQVRPHTAHAAARAHVAQPRARSGPGEQVIGRGGAADSARSPHPEPGPCSRAEARGDSGSGGGEARLPTWEPHLQLQAANSPASAWSMSNRVTVANPQKGFRNRPPRPHSARAGAQTSEDGDNGSGQAGGGAAMASPLGHAMAAVSEPTAAVHASHAVHARGISLTRLDHPRQRSAPLSRAQRLQAENRELAQLYLGTLSQLRDSMEEQEALSAALREKDERRPASAALR